MCPLSLKSTQTKYLIKKAKKVVFRDSGFRISSVLMFAQKVNRIIFCTRMIQSSRPSLGMRWWNINKIFGKTICNYENIKVLSSLILKFSFWGFSINCFMDVDVSRPFSVFFFLVFFKLLTF